MDAVGRQRRRRRRRAADDRAVVENLQRVVHAPEETLRLVVLCLVAEGHLIIEDLPGRREDDAREGARPLARRLVLAAPVHPDLLPSDVTGVNVFNQAQNEFEFRPGPVFANLLLVDEINRASPKTQSALLECMQERQVTIDGVSYELAPPFMVIATQNPIEYEGTYPLPEAQLDRFAMRVAIGYPTLADEARMLTEQTSGSPLETLEPVTNGQEVLALVEEAQAIFVEESVNRYVVALLRHTRGDSRLYLGGSPRAGIALVRVAKARALADGRDFLSPDDVKAIAEPCSRTGLIVAPEARAAGDDEPRARPRRAREDARPGLMLTRRGRLLLVLGGALLRRRLGVRLEGALPGRDRLSRAVLVAALERARRRAPDGPPPPFGTRSSTSRATTSWSTSSSSPAACSGSRR